MVRKIAKNTGIHILKDLATLYIQGCEVVTNVATLHTASFGVD